MCTIVAMARGYRGRRFGPPLRHSQVDSMSPTAASVPGMTPPRADLDRRKFLGAVGGVAGLATLAQLPVGPANATPRPAGGNYPFTLGVASGDPTPTGVVLWTRLVPDRFVPGGGMPATKVPVEW